MRRPTLGRFRAVQAELVSRRPGWPSGGVEVWEMRRPPSGRGGESSGRGRVACRGKIFSLGSTLVGQFGNVSAVRLEKIERRCRGLGDQQARVNGASGKASGHGLLEVWSVSCLGGMRWQGALSSPNECCGVFGGAGGGGGRDGRGIWWVRLYRVSEKEAFTGVWVWRGT